MFKRRDKCQGCNGKGQVKVEFVSIVPRSIKRVTQFLDTTCPNCVGTGIR